MPVAIDIRPPVSRAAFSTTTTTIATLTIPAKAGTCICVTGYSIVYGTAPNTAVTPLLTFGTAATVLGNVTGNTASQFPFPLRGPSGKACALSASVTAAAAISLSLLYYRDKA